MHHFQAVPPYALLPTQQFSTWHVPVAEREREAACTEVASPEARSATLDFPAHNREYVGRGWRRAPANGTLWRA
jgi:hypothetical protein